MVEFEVRRCPPQVRTIRFVMKSNYRRFAFPELIFCFNAGDIIVLIDQGEKFFPFKFYNIDQSGKVCLPGPAFSLEHGINLFWNSIFTQNYFTGNFWLNDEKRFIDTDEWENMTNLNPDFMKKEFNPLHYAKHYFAIGKLWLAGLELSASISERLKSNPSGKSK